MARRRSGDAAAGRGGGAGSPTPAAMALRALGLAFETLEYQLGPDAGEATLGQAAAAALNVPPATVFKTLIAEVDGAFVCALVPVTGNLCLKALASARGGKRAVLAHPAAAERLTGYVTGGISPLGQRRALPTFMDASAQGLAHMHVSAGKRGLQLRLNPADLVAATGAVLVQGLAV